MLRTRRVLVIGSLGHHAREMWKGIHAYCRIHGNWEFHLEAENNPEMVKHARLVLRTWKAEGIIARIDHERIIRLVQNAGVPAVNVLGVYDLKMPTVICDDIQIGRTIARYFLDNGFHNFAFSSVNQRHTTQKRCDGFAGELAAAGFTCDVFHDNQIPHQEFNYAQDRRNMDRWLLSLKKPVAIMCTHDYQGQVITSACRRLGLRVPDDVAIVGVNNDEDIWCRISNPPLSSLDANLQQVGYEAIRLLNRMIHGGKPPSKPLLIPPRQVIVRQSSDIIAIDDHDIAAAVRFIRDHAYEPISVKDLLLKVPISRRAMERRFVKTIGRTPRAEITRIRMERATQLLAETDLAIPNVARGTGFTNPDIFSAFFRKRMSLTPTQYRRNCRTGSLMPSEKR